MKEKVTIKIPKELYLKLKDITRGTGFSSVTDFIVFTVRTVAMGGRISEKTTFKEKELKEIRERLRKLGYLK